MQLRSLLVLAVIAVSNLAHAQEYRLKDLRIENPYARATVPHQPSGGAYVTIENVGKEADRLIAVSSPVAKSGELHMMSMDDNVMRMREVSGIDLTPATKVEMKPGDGYHVMLMGLRQPLKAGDRFPLKLIFEKSGTTEVSVTVRDIGKQGAGSAAHHKH
ncbi:MAG TPA: copper chaperone PCu(A)C [Noviherbaspirillum sp.]|nr:copper chaperone PCu(A)C [Noviherbaspirillum sp.]